MLLRLAFPLAAAGVAAFGAANGWGLLNHFQVPFPITVSVSVVAKELVIRLLPCWPRPGTPMPGSFKGA